MDVRTEEGDDAGALFTDMLRGLGARILTAGVGQTCTHVVYKNGSPSTITKVKLMDEPARPKVVGIGWVVACAENRERTDETKYEVDIESVNVAGGAKVRCLGCLSFERLQPTLFFFLRDASLCYRSPFHQMSLVQWMPSSQVRRQSLPLLEVLVRQTVYTYRAILH